MTVIVTVTVTVIVIVTVILRVKPTHNTCLEWVLW